MILRIAKRIFLPVAIIFLAYFAWQSRDMLGDVIRNANVLHLAIATGTWLLMNGIAAVFSTQVFRALEVPLSYGTAARIHVANLPARYVPGGIWHTVGRAANFRQLGTGARDITIFIFLENVLAICVAFVLGGLLLATTRGFEGWGQIAVFAACAGGALLIASPFLLATRVVRDGIRFPVRKFLLLTILTALSWCVAATAFVTYLSAFPGIAGHIAPLEVAGSYLFSWGVGFITVFAPQGVGVFEVVAANLMRGTEPLMGVAALVAGFRLIILAADVTAWVALQLLSGFAVRQGRDLLGDQPDQEDNH